MWSNLVLGKRVTLAVSFIKLIHIFSPASAESPMLYREYMNLHKSENGYDQGPAQVQFYQPAPRWWTRARTRGYLLVKSWPDLARPTDLKLAHSHRTVTLFESFFIIFFQQSFLLTCFFVVCKLDWLSPWLTRSSVGKMHPSVSSPATCSKVSITLHCAVRWAPR